MEDTADKIRRNVVMLSAIIIGSAWLGIEANEAFPTLSSILIKVSPKKFWTLTATILAYFVWRLYNDETQVDAKEEYRNCVLLKKRDYIYVELTKIIKRRIFKNKETKEIQLDSKKGSSDALDNFCNTEFVKLNEKEKLEIHTIATPTNPTWQEGTTTIRLQAPNEKLIDLGSYLYKVSRINWIRIIIKSNFFAIKKFDRGTIEVAVPYILATIAGLICISKIISAFTHPIYWC